MNKEIDKIYDPSGNMTLAVNNRLYENERILFQLMQLDEHNKAINTVHYFMYPSNALLIATEGLLDSNNILSDTEHHINHILFDKMKTIDTVTRKLQIRISRPGMISLLVQENKVRLFLNIPVARYRTLLFNLLMACTSFNLAKDVKLSIQEEIADLKADLKGIIRTEMSKIDGYIDHPF